MKEYKVIRDDSASKNNPYAMQKKLNEEAKEGWKLVSSCCMAQKISSYVFMFLEREV